MTTAEIEIYSDEIVVPKDFKNKDRNFICIGCLFVPASKKDALITNLINQRCLFEGSKKWVWGHSDCSFSKECKLNWHTSNSSEIHHAEIRKSRSSNSQIKIAKRWLKYLIEQNKQEKEQIYFNILYIDLDVLEIENFGKEKIHENIYNKFFRTAIDYGAKAFFGNFQKVIIKKVYHDKGSMEFHKYFPYLNLLKLDTITAKNIFIEDTNIHFLDSDHSSYIKNGESLYHESHLIQYVDLVIGTATQNIFYLSDDTLKKEIAMILRPLVERLLEKPYNKNSSYNYYGRQKISFFPKYKIENSRRTIADLNGDIFETFREGQFYSGRAMEMPPYDLAQQSLNKWFSA